MKKILSYPLSFLFYLCFGINLLVFHAAQWIALNTLGYYTQKRTVDILNFLIIRCLYLLGTKIRYEHKTSLPDKRPIIFVANHQSTFDIPPLIWHLRKYHAKFVSKIELGNGIPSISFNLRHGGSVLIDRNNPKEAFQKIEEFGKKIYTKKHSVIIFPEGTRSKNGKMKKFHQSGLIALLNTMPNVLIVPITIINSWKFSEKNYFPMMIGNKLIFKFHRPVINNKKEKESLVNTIERIIKKGLN